MANKEKKHGFLVDFDILFDTRLAVLQSIDQEIADDLLMTGYYSRDRDEFPNIDLSEFRDRYQNRDLNTLMHSKMTTLMMTLKDTIGHYMVANIAEGRPVNIEIILNIYPYKLNEYEINQAVQSIKVRTGNIVPIRVINAPLKVITPEWLDNNVVSFYCYNWSEWIQLHQLDLMRKRLDGVNLIAPKIMPLSRQEGANQVSEIEQEMKDVLNGNSRDLIDDEMDPFKLTENLLCQSSIAFSFYETRDFCIYLPDEMPTPPGKFFEE